MSSETVHVGPIIFADETARGQLLDEGEVVTYRTSPRTTGDTWARWSRTGPKEADVTVEEIDADGLLGEMLEPFVDLSGFDSLQDWMDAIEELNGERPIAGGWLYRVELEART